MNGIWPVYNVLISNFSKFSIIFNFPIINSNLAIQKREYIIYAMLIIKLLGFRVRDGIEISKK